MKDNLTADTFSVTHVNGGLDSDIAIKTTAAFGEAHSLLWDPIRSSFVGSSDIMGGYMSRRRTQFGGMERHRAWPWRDGVMFENI